MSCPSPHPLVGVAKEIRVPHFRALLIKIPAEKAKADELEQEMKHRIGRMETEQKRIRSERGRMELAGDSLRGPRVGTGGVAALGANVVRVVTQKSTRVKSEFGIMDKIKSTITNTPFRMVSPDGFTPTFSTPISPTISPPPDITMTDVVTGRPVGEARYPRIQGEFGQHYRELFGRSPSKRTDRPRSN